MTEDTAAATGSDTTEDNPSPAAGEDVVEARGTDADVDPKLGEAGEKALAAFKARAREAEKQARELASKVKEFEDRDKSEQDKLNERVTTAEERASKAEARLLRFEVATAKKLPLELADRLQGDDKDQLEADADRLLELVKPNGKPAGDIDAGKGEGGSGTTFNDAIRQRARV